jgi:hypothetical protein
LEGNREVDFDGRRNAVRTWYHAPWMHSPDRGGREFIHGLTRERPSAKRALAPTQTQPAENWAVSMYNPRGGFVLGEVWRNPDAPNPGKASFPEGTVSFKLLLTSAPVAQVPYLERSLAWQADIDRADDARPRPTMRLLQIDVAVRDSRADSTTGWVFGTFIYNGRAAGASIWERMVPIGLMWGNDPERLFDDRPLQETVIIDPSKFPVPQHLGLKGRLNGPVDNPESSCLSCHSTAQVSPDLSRPRVPGVVMNATRDQLRSYFRNIPAGSPFSAGLRALDYSLQLQNGIANRAEAGGLEAPPNRSRANLLDAANGVAVKPIRR